MYYFPERRKTARLTAAEMVDLYAGWAEVSIISIEDGFHEDDWAAYAMLTERIGEVQIVGDDLLFVITSRKRLQMGIDQRSQQLYLIKLNQIGTVTRRPSTPLNLPPTSAGMTSDRFRTAPVRPRM